MGIDRDLLEDLLGVPVNETVATTGEGLDELKAAIGTCPDRTCRPRSRSPTWSRWLSRVGSRAEALMVLEGDEIVSRAPCSAGRYQA